MNDYKDYAEKVVNGDIVAGKYIIKACQRYLSWFSRDDIYFDEEKAGRVVRFISKLKHFQGKSSGHNFILEPWQKWIVYSIYGWYYKDTGLRVCNKAFILVARKNGKSAFASALCLYSLLCDEEAAAQVLNVANSREQGKLLFDMEVGLAKSIDPRGKHLIYQRDRIKFNATSSYSRCLSSDSSGLDGLSASTFVCDETHEYKDSKLWDVLISSQGFRSNPLAIQISTAGFNLFGFCHKYRQMCIDIVSGVKNDDTQFAAIYELDEEDDWADEKNWVKSNPNLDITVNRKYLRDQVLQAKNNSSLEVGIRTKNFNQWLSSSDIWISNNILLDSSIEITPEFFIGKYCYLGIDLAAVSDLCAISLMTVDNGTYYFKNYYYAPSSVLQDNPNSEMYKEWKRAGKLIITPGNVADYDYILGTIMELLEKGIIIEKVSYDSWNATQFAINATSQGLPLEPFSQSIGNFNKPTKEFERLVKSGKVKIDNNELTRWCFSNVALKTDYNQNTKPIKGGDDTGKIDGVIAMIEALGGYLESPLYNNEIMII